MLPNGTSRGGFTGGYSARPESAYRAPQQSFQSYRAPAMSASNGGFSGRGFEGGKEQKSGGFHGFGGGREEKSFKAPKLPKAPKTEKFSGGHGERGGGYGGPGGGHRR